MNHNVYKLLAVIFLNAFIGGSFYAASEIQDDGHGDLHGHPGKKKTTVQGADDGHGDLHQPQTHTGVSKHDHAHGNRKGNRPSSHL